MLQNLLSAAVVIGALRVKNLTLSLLVATNFGCLLITIANSLDLDQDRQNISPVMDPNYFALVRVFLKEFFEKVNLEKKKSADHKKT